MDDDGIGGEGGGAEGGMGVERAGEGIGRAFGSSSWKSVSVKLWFYIYWKIYLWTMMV